MSDVAGKGLNLGLSGRRAVVTGASRGIGRATGLALAAQGARVAFCHHERSSASEELDHRIQRDHADSFLLEADVSDQASVAELAATVRERLGRVDILVNNAGVVGHRGLADLDPGEWHRVLDTNLTGTYLVTRALLPLLAEGAAIVNVGSAVGLVGQEGLAHYTASKAGLLGLTRSLAKELGRRGVRVNAVAPGISETDQAAAMPEERRAYYLRRIPLGRLAEAADIAAACLFLVSPLAAYVNGATLLVDGGI